MAKAEVTIKLMPDEFDLVREALLIAHEHYHAIANDREKDKNAQWAAGSQVSRIERIQKVFGGS